MWVLYGEESGEERHFNTKKEAIEAKRDTDRFHREQGLSKEIWQIWHEED